jgi:hypothetical protein
MPEVPLLRGGRGQNPVASAMYGALFAALFMFAVLAAFRFVKRSSRGRISLRTKGVSAPFFATLEPI